jgi:hypothetical protein
MSTGPPALVMTGVGAAVKASRPALTVACQIVLRT